MPVSAVKYEDLWDRAKAIVKKQYPAAKETQYWRLVMGIYRKMETERDASK